MRKTQSKKISHNSTRRTAYAIRLVHMNPGSQSVPLNANRTIPGFFIIFDYKMKSTFGDNLGTVITKQLLKVHYSTKKDIRSKYKITWMDNFIMWYNMVIGNSFIIRRLENGKTIV